jgi:hypothetical protein
MSYPSGMFVLVSTDGGGHLDSDGEVKVHGVYSHQDTAYRYARTLSKMCQGPYHYYQVHELPAIDAVPQEILDETMKQATIRKANTERKQAAEETMVRDRVNPVLERQRQLEDLYASIPSETRDAWKTHEPLTSYAKACIEDIIDDANKCLWHFYDDFFHAKRQGIQKRVQAHLPLAHVHLHPLYVEYLEGCYEFGGISVDDTK